MKLFKLQIILLTMVLAGGLMANSSSDVPTHPAVFHIQLLPIPGTFRSPVFAADPGDGTGRLFVVEKRGVVKLVIDGVPSKHPFLDIRNEVRSTGAEQGLLSLAFHPRFAESGVFFVVYTDERDDVVVAKFNVSSRDRNRADPESRSVLLIAMKQYPDHNGGLARFGPDGYLYIGIGDGGAGTEPEQNAQRLDTLLGKLLRIDVDNIPEGASYGIPPNNPFIGIPGARPEIWAIGLRNPWRFSFDRLSGDLYVADVGWGGPEEVNVQPAESGGANYGWSLFEGPRCFRPHIESTCSDQGMTAPVWSYEHPENGCAVVGGHVYRGTALPDLVGPTCLPTTALA